MTGWEKYREPIARELYEHGGNYDTGWNSAQPGERRWWLDLADAVIAVLPPLPDDSHPEPDDPAGEWWFGSFTIKAEREMPEAACPALVWISDHPKSKGIGIVPSSADQLAQRIAAAASWARRSGSGTP